MKLKSICSLGLLLSLYLSVVCQAQAYLGAYQQAVRQFYILVCHIVELKVTVCRLRELLYLFGILAARSYPLEGSTDQETSNFKRIEKPHSFSFRPLCMKLRSQPVAVVVGEGNPLHPPFPRLTDVLFVIMYPGKRIQE